MRVCFLVLLFLTIAAKGYAVTLFEDNFERTDLGGNWSVSDANRALITGQTASQPGGRSMAIRFGFATATSSASYNLSLYNTATLSFWWRRGADSFSEDPDFNENLQVQYLNNTGIWTDLLVLNGGFNFGEIGQANLTIPALAMTSDFRFRFLLSNGSGNNFDYWHIDDVVLEATGLLTCFSDNFNRLSMGDNWVSSRTSGFFSPDIVSNNRMRITQDVGNQATALSLQRLFPSEGNLIIIDFDHYAWSPNGGIGADGISLVLSDAKVTPQAGAPGGSLGYAQFFNSRNGFAGGWLGIAIDEWGNFATRNEGRQGGGTSVIRNSISMRGSGTGTSGYNFITSTATLNPIIEQRGSNTPGPGHRYRFVMDSTTLGQFVVSVLRDTGSGFTPLIAPRDILSETGQAALPEDFFLSFTGSTGGFSNNHEIDNLQICAQEIKPLAATVHHFEWVFDSSALTCSAKNVTLRACDNADCSVLYTDPVSVDLSPSGWVGGDTITFTGGIANVSLRQPVPGTVALNVETSDPPRQAFQTDVCIRNGVAGNDCRITFSDSGFLIDVDNFVAAEGIQNATVSAVKKDPNNDACIPEFANVDRNVEFWYRYQAPNTGSMAVSVRGNSAASPTYQVLSTTEASAVSVPLRFDANGQAEIDVNYADAGLMQLNARYTESLTGGILRMAGSDDFVTRPAGFCITAERLDGTANSCTSADSDCSVFVKAGEDFNISVQAVAFDNNTPANLCDNAGTPNYSRDRMALSLNRVAPSPGVDGALSVTEYNHLADSTGNNNGTQLTRLFQTEVGVFDFTVAQVDDYFSQPGFNIPAATTQVPVGRFYPDHFDVVVSNNGSLHPFCSQATPFSYSGQAIGWNIAPSLTVTARNRQNLVMSNYTRGGFMKLDSSGVIIDPVNQDSSAKQADGVTGIELTSILNSGMVVVADPASGQVQYQFNSLDTFTYTRVPQAEVAPFVADIDLTINRIQDIDGVQLITTAPLIEPDGNQQIRFGRWRLSNTYGPEVVDLTVAADVEYFDGINYVINQDDRCTVYSSANASVDAISEILTGSGALNAGSADIGLRAPVDVAGTPDTGTATVRYTADPWLQGDYNNDGIYEDPSATAIFGVFRGHDRIIYWREITN